MIPEEGKRALVELLEEHQVPLIEDDVFGDLCYGFRRPGTCKAWDRTGNVIYCSSFSKSLTAGWRIGWVLGGKYKERIIQLKSLFTLTTSSVTQKAIAAFLREESYEKHLRRLRSHLARQMGCLQETVANAFPSGTRTSRPQGGVALWVELPQGVDALELYHRALEAGIGFTPGPAFSTSGKFENYIRLCAGFWNREIAEAVERLGSMVGTQGADSRAALRFSPTQRAPS
jgi:DNA-binding transcriptional MocR family regulator